MIKMKITFDIIWKIVCLLGCVYQTFKISELYFSYETTTNVRYETEKLVNLPGITICYDKKSQLQLKDKKGLLEQACNYSIHGYI